MAPLHTAGPREEAAALAPDLPVIHPQPRAPRSKGLVQGAGSEGELPAAAAEAEPSSLRRPF